MSNFDETLQPTHLPDGSPVATATFDGCLAQLNGVLALWAVIGMEALYRHMIKQLTPSCRVLVASDEKPLRATFLAYKLSGAPIGSELNNDIAAKILMMTATVH
jgi:hypothetical protein